ncbi:hypothetical protein [Paenibacillus spongiae]|uniref:Peptidase A2 domain-containing protein n=1 Tax=Paenibacillus spongiae TaxID=2909671 RepID=A0ABY5S682_9BACL|nr:hypothetical protein [Paenibacillus spongiae]UVI29416.1 hypothetical protein L1F29_29020 [Paenibacillus spongiae]
MPAEFIENRIIVRPKTKQGTTFRLLADTGGGCFITPEAARKANLFVSEDIMDGARCKLAEPPIFLDSDWIPPLMMKGDHGKYPVLEEQSTFLEGLDGLIGQAWFADRVWTFDYFAEKIIYHDQWASNKSITNDRCHCVQLGFQKDNNGVRNNHFPRIQAVIDGETIDFLFDTGATLCLSDKGLSELNDKGSRFRGTSFITHSVFKKWVARHPDWRVIGNAEQHTGLPIIEVPEMIIAGCTVGPVWFTMRPDPNFHEFMSQWMDKQVEGALGGSVFQYFRITLDYPNELAYFMR